MRAADSDGLDASDYKFPDFAAASGADALAEAELKLTETLLTYARHVQAGRFSYSQRQQEYRAAAAAAGALRGAGQGRRCR